MTSEPRYPPVRVGPLDERRRGPHDPNALSVVCSEAHGLCGVAPMTQLAMALEQTERGIKRSADHAEALDAGWGAAAYRVLTDYARNAQGHPFTSEDFRDHLAAINFPVPVPKALGAVFKSAARHRVIRRVGFGISKARHLSPCPMWSV